MSNPSVRSGVHSLMHIPVWTGMVFALWLTGCAGEPDVKEEVPAKAPRKSLVPFFGNYSYTHDIGRDPIGAWMFVGHEVHVSKDSIVYSSSGYQTWTNAFCTYKFDADTLCLIRWKDRVDPERTWGDTLLRMFIFQDTVRWLDGHYHFDNEAVSYVTPKRYRLHRGKGKSAQPAPPDTVDAAYTLPETHWPEPPHYPHFGKYPEGLTHPDFYNPPQQLGEGLVFLHEGFNGLYWTEFHPSLPMPIDLYNPQVEGVLPVFFKPGYGLVAMVMLDKTPDWIEVEVNEDSRARIDPKDSITMMSWEQVLLEKITGMATLSGDSARWFDAPGGMEIRKTQDLKQIKVQEVQGEWLRATSPDGAEGWLRWRKGDSLLMELHFLC